MSVHKFDQYTLLSFELTDRFSAWFKMIDDSPYEVPIHAVGLATLEVVTHDTSTNNELRRENLGNFLVGLEFSQDGVQICDEDSNFRCILPRGVTYKSDDPPTRAVSPQSGSQPPA